VPRAAGAPPRRTSRSSRRRFQTHIRHQMPNGASSSSASRT
jgi:hypothetical protein